VSRIVALSSAQVIGLLVAAAGLAAGIAAAATSTTELGVVAGLLGFGGAALVALGARSPAEDTAPAHIGPVLVDEQTGLLVAEVFNLLVNVRITTAKRYLRPLAVVHLEVDVDPMTTLMLESITRALIDTLRDCDSPCRLSENEFGVILEDTPETGAVWAIERVRRHLQKQMPGTILRAGIACYPAHSIEPDAVNKLAAEALTLAREWPQDRIEIAHVE
jgi:GGDEF domain-containing protein